MKLNRARKYCCLNLKKINRRSYFLSIAILLLIGLFPATALADNTEADTEDIIPPGGILGVELVPAYPQTEDQKLFYYEIKPGSAIEDSMWLVNLRDEENTIRVVKTFAKQKEDGEYAYSLEEDDQIEVPTWITFEDETSKDYTLEPNEYRKINFVLKVPENTDYRTYKGGFAVQKTQEAAEGAVFGNTFRKITKIDVNVTENPAEFIKPSTLVFTPNTYVWVALAIFVLSLLYYIGSLIKQKRQKRKK